MIRAVVSCLRSCKEHVWTYIIEDLLALAQAVGLVYRVLRLVIAESVSLARCVRFVYRVLRLGIAGTLRAKRKNIMSDEV
jgi:hypothetical protein